MTSARCLVVDAAATAALVAVGGLSLPEVSSAGSADGFADLLVSGCAVASLAAAAWLWSAVTIVVVDALRGTGQRQRCGVPRAVRRAVLVACGAALLAPAAPAVADHRADHRADRPDDVSVLHGLPLPARPTSIAARAVGTASRTAPPPPPSSHGRLAVVRTGDTLWALAAADLSPDAPAADVTRRWHRVHELNRAVIGDDPDLIHPGQQLRLPPAPHGGAQQ